MTPSPHPPSPELFDRYFAGQCTGLETAEIEAFLATSPRWRRVADIKPTLNLSGVEQTSVPAAAAWERLQLRVREVEDNSRQSHGNVGWKHSWTIATAVVAVFLVMIGTGTWFTSASDPLLGTDRQWTNSAGVREYIVRRGERAVVHLVDGTTVTLGPESRLRYPAAFGRGTRIVDIEGQGYFSVTHDPAHPFTVYAGNAAIQELGTEFGVTAYRGDSTVRVVVAGGRVAVRDRSAKPHTGVALGRGDAAFVYATGLATVTRNVDIDATFGWVQGHLTFHDVQLSEVVRELERWYDVQIATLPPHIAQRRITLTIGPESLDEVLMQLHTVLGIRSTRIGHTITITEER